MATWRSSRTRCACPGPACVSSTVKASTMYGGGHQRRHRGGEQDDDGDGDDGRDRLEGLALVPVGQAVDEDGDEGGREDAAQHDVVEHVGRGVGQVVGVGQEGLAERPGQGHEAEQPGEPRDAGPDRDVGGRGPQREGPGPAGGGHGQCARGTQAPRAAPGAHPPGQQDGAGQDGEGHPDEGDGGGVHGEHGAGEEQLAVGRVQRHVDGEPVARGAGLRRDADRGRRAVERSVARVAVGEAELVAVERDDDAHRVGGGREHGDGDGRPLRGEGHGALGGQRDLARLVVEGPGVGARARRCARPG